MKDKYDEIYSQDFNVNNIPHGWIQWKGTDVCIDLYCECGCHSHIDGDFFYYFQCPECKQIYAVGQNIKLIKMTEKQINRNEVNTAMGHGALVGEL